MSRCAEKYTLQSTHCAVLIVTKLRRSQFQPKNLIKVSKKGVTTTTIALKAQNDMKSRFSCLFLLRATLTGPLMKSLQAARKRINRSIQVEHPFPYLHLPSPSPCPCLWVQLAFLREERSELPRRLGSTATLHRMTGTQLILHLPFSSTLPPPLPIQHFSFFELLIFLHFFDTQITY